MSENDWIESLRRLFSSNCQNTLHLIGVGNPLRKDDGLGIEVVKKLKKHCRNSKHFKIHSLSFRTESLISKIEYARDKVLIFDAVEFGSFPGAIIVSSMNDSRFGFFATHNIPISALPGISSQLGNLLLLGIQPLDLDVGEGLSDQVSNSVEKVVSALSGLMVK